MHYTDIKDGKTKYKNTTQSYAHTHTHNERNSTNKRETEGNTSSVQTILLSPLNHIQTGEKLKEKPEYMSGETLKNERMCFERIVTLVKFRVLENL